MQEEYDEDDEDDIRVKEKEDFSDSSGYARPQTPNNSDMCEQELLKRGDVKNVSNFVESGDETIEEVNEDLKRRGLRASKSMPQIHLEATKVGIKV